MPLGLVTTMEDWALWNVDAGIDPRRLVRVDICDAPTLPVLPSCSSAPAEWPRRKLCDGAREPDDTPCLAKVYSFAAGSRRGGSVLRRPPTRGDRLGDDRIDRGDDVSLTGDITRTGTSTDTGGAGGTAGGTGEPGDVGGGTGDGELGRESPRDRGRCVGGGAGCVGDTVLLPDAKLVRLLAKLALAAARAARKSLIGAQLHGSRSNTVAGAQPQQTPGQYCNGRGTQQPPGMCTQRSPDAASGVPWREMGLPQRDIDRLRARCEVDVLGGTVLSSIITARERQGMPRRNRQ